LAQIVNLCRNFSAIFGLNLFCISHSMPWFRYLSTRIAVDVSPIVEIGTRADYHDPQQ